MQLKIQKKKMNLETKLKKRKLAKKPPTEEVLKQAEKGNRFIVVQDDFDISYVPMGYTLIDMKHKGDSFKTLIPQSLLFYMANPGEGDAESALEEISDFYGEAKDFEDEMIENGSTSVQQANWATLSRESYKIYLINRLVKHKKGETDERGEPVPEFNPEILEKLNLNEDYVAQRVRAMAALALGKTSKEEVKKYNIDTILKHVTIREERKEELTREEFSKVTCWAGSHYELKPEYMNRDDVKYEIECRHDRGYKVGTKTIKAEKTEFLDSRINELEREITDYRKNNGCSVGRHDTALIREYVNLAYIIPENPGMQLDIQPPEKTNIKN